MDLLIDLFLIDLHVSRSGVKVKTVSVAEFLLRHYFQLIAKASIFAYHTEAYVKSEIKPFSETNHREENQ
jgi:hypothetical protein